MKYVGSKAKLAKYILPIMLAARRSDQWWVEPFVGGANLLARVDGKRIGSDSNHYLIDLLKAVQGGWVPPTAVSRDMYHSIKREPQRFAPELVGFVGFLCSFGSQWWSGYAFSNDGRNYAGEGSRALVKQSLRFGGIVFRCGDYRDLAIPPNSLIYCDPPYEGTTGYDPPRKGTTGYRDTLDHVEFWEWCRNRATDGHTVFVSEYAAPVDFECVKAIAYKTIINRNPRHPRIEKLFRSVG